MTMNSAITSDVIVKCLKMYDDVQTPEYKTSGSSGCDIRAHFTDDFLTQYKRLYGGVNINDNATAIFIPPFNTIVIPTGIKVEIPYGYEIQVRSRSGMAVDGVSVANGIGTIDSDYRGEIKVILTNSSDKMYKIYHGDRIAQLILSKVERMFLELTEQLTTTHREDGGFGSTGK